MISPQRYANWATKPGQLRNVALASPTQIGDSNT